MPSRRRRPLPAPVDEPSARMHPYQNSQQIWDFIPIRQSACHRAREPLTYELDHSVVAGRGKVLKDWRTYMVVVTGLLVGGLFIEQALAQVSFAPGVCYTYTQDEDLPAVYMLTAGNLNNLALTAHKEYMEKYFEIELSFGSNVEGICHWYNGFPAGVDDWILEVIEAIILEFNSLGYSRM